MRSPPSIADDMAEMKRLVGEAAGGCWHWTHPGRLLRILAYAERLEARVEFFNHTFQPLVGMVGLAIASGDLDKAAARFDALNEAWGKSHPALEPS